MGVSHQDQCPSSLPPSQFIIFDLILAPTGDLQCFGRDCYPLAFGVPAVLMLIAIALFWGGRHGYKRSPPSGNVVGQVVKAIGYALKKKFTTKVS